MGTKPVMVVGKEEISTTPGSHLWGGLAVAILPAFLLVIASTALNRFALLDDGVLLAGTRGQFLDNFRIGDSGRFFFLLSVYQWVLVRVLPPQPWAFSVGNGVLLIIAACQVHYLARRLAGPLAGIAAAWFFTLNLSTVENIFTLAKAEPKQLVFWLAALALMGRAIEGTANRRGRFEAPLLFLCTTGTVLTKEAGVLLFAPLALLAVSTIGKWTTLQRRDRRRRLTLIAAGVAPLAGFAALVLLYGLRAGSYGRAVVTAQPLTLGHFVVAFLATDAIFAIMLVAGLLAGLLLVFCRLLPARGALVSILLMQLVALVAFFTSIQATMLYYYYPAAALASVLLGAVLFNPIVRTIPWRMAAALVTLVLLLYGVDRTIAGASALSVWSGLDDRLTNAVISERPARVLFEQAGSWETHVQARLVWGELSRLPIGVGVLDRPGDPEPFIPTVSIREVRTGDWIVQVFGTSLNARIPFRGLTITRSPEDSLMNDVGDSLLPVRLVHEFKGRFGFPAHRFALFTPRRSYILWKVYQLVGTPRAAFENLDTDRWMSSHAELWVRDPSGGMTLRFTSYIPDGAQYANELTVYAGVSVVARCPGMPRGVSRCNVDLASVAGRTNVEGWVRLEMRAAKTFVPREFGAIADSRNLSFNFKPTWEAGAGKLFSEPGPIGQH